ASGEAVASRVSALAAPGRRRLARKSLRQRSRHGYAAAEVHRVVADGSRANRVASVSVEAPARQYARSAHTGCMSATSNAGWRDASAATLAASFRREP